MISMARTRSSLGKSRLRTWGLSILGVVAFGIACVALKDHGLEQFYLWQLGSRDLSRVESAAVRLGEMRSTRAARPLVALFATSYEEVVHAGWMRGANTDARKHQAPCLAALAALQAIGKPAIPALAEGLKTAGEPLEAQLLRLLCGFGADAQAAFPEITAALRAAATRAKHQEVALGAPLTLLRPTQALVEIGETAIPVLLSTLGDEDARVRAEGTFALATLGAAALPGLQETLRYGHPTARQAATESLWLIVGGPHSKVTRTEARKILDDTSSARPLHHGKRAQP